MGQPLDVTLMSFGSGSKITWNPVQASVQKLILDGYSGGRKKNWTLSDCFFWLLSHVHRCTSFVFAHALYLRFRRFLVHKAVGARPARLQSALKVTKTRSCATSALVKKVQQVFRPQKNHKTRLVVKTQLVSTSDWGWGWPTKERSQIKDPSPPWTAALNNAGCFLRFNFTRSPGCRREMCFSSRWGQANVMLVWKDGRRGGAARDFLLRGWLVETLLLVPGSTEKWWRSQRSGWEGGCWLNDVKLYM